MTDRQTGNALELHKVRKLYQGQAAVENLSLTAQYGRWTAILGPSGSGKTTTLRICAGLVQPDGGRVVIGGQDVTGHPPNQRNVGLVFQSYALFPHMNVHTNIAYGLRRRGASRAEAAGRVDESLELVQLSGFGERYPHQLSGGEQQRVALARALVTKPAVLLLDEPLSNLDAKLRREMRHQLQSILLQVDTAPIIVTHDQEEAMALGEELVVMRKGQVMQVGSPTDVYARPANEFVANFIGDMNWLVADFVSDEGAGLARFLVKGGQGLVARLPGTRTRGPWKIGVRPERIRVHRDDEVNVDQAPNVLKGVVRGLEILGDELEALVDVGTQTLRCVSKDTGQFGLKPGDPASVRIQPQDCVPVALAEPNSGPSAETKDTDAGLEMGFRSVLP